MEFNRVLNPTIYNGLPKDAQGDIYRIVNNIPLEGHGPERYLASKPPLRKNKDYRPKFRNFSFGFPIYKKDNYTRHWYNFSDIMRDEHAPIMKYTKTFLKAYIWAAFVASFYVSTKPEKFGLSHAQMRTNSNYTKLLTRFEPYKLYYRKGKGMALGFAVLATFFRIFGDHLVNSYNYSSHEALIRTIAYMSVPTIFLLKDRFYSPFWITTGAFCLTSYFFLYIFFINNNYADTGKRDNKATYFYLKSVTPEEKEKIEFQDKIENFTRNFLENEQVNIYGYIDDRNSALRSRLI